MCEHEFVQEEWIVEVCKKCGKLQQAVNLEQQLAAAKAELAAAVKKVEDFDLVVVMNKKICSELDAAKARVAELEQQQFAGQTWVTFNEHMKALNKIKQMEDAIKFDFERFMEFQRRAEREVHQRGMRR